MMVNDTIRDFYSQPQTGNGLAVFSGSRRQMGGSFLSGLARYALPVLKFLGGKALNIASNVAADVITDKKPLGQSLKRRAKEEIVSTLKRGRGASPPLKRLNINKPLNINKYKYLPDNLS